jgi:hypothetical protein
VPSQVHAFFAATFRGDEAFSCGTESLECKLFAEDEVPWHELAFPTSEVALRAFFRSASFTDSRRPAPVPTYAEVPHFDVWRPGTPPQ